MRREPGKGRLRWIVAGGIGLILAIVFIASMAPAGSPGDAAPILRPSSAAPDDPASLATAQAPRTDGDGSSGFRLGLGGATSLAWRLALVVVILGGSVVGLRWWGKRTSGPKSVTGFLRVVDTLAISNGRTVHLIALGDRVIAVGATAQQLTLLNELKPQEAGMVLAALPPPGDQPLATFAAELFQSMRGVPSRKRAIGSEAVIDTDLRPDVRG